MKTLLISCLLMFSFHALAQGTPVADSAENETSESVLDFEAEIIEGQRKAPQVFMQMELGTPDLDSVMYLRQNFNDFHNVEAKRKPRYRRAVR